MDYKFLKMANYFEMYSKPIIFGIRVNPSFQLSPPGSNDLKKGYFSEVVT